MDKESENHAPTARSKPTAPGEEEAGAELKLGEFTNVDTLTLSEAKLVLQVLTDKRERERRSNETDTLQKTMDYLDAFARFEGHENISAVERLLAQHGQLSKFERAQIGSLCCDTAEECKTLIPSISDKISDDDLKELLDEMAKFMKN